MVRRARTRRVAAWGIVAVLLISLGFALVGTTAAQTADYRVTTDDSGDFSSVQAAVDHATDGDTIVVETGTYNEAVTVDKNVTLIADGSVTIANESTTDAAVGIGIGGDAAPEIRGFTLVGWQKGVDGYGTTGDWTVKDTRVRAAQIGINGDSSTGDWLVSDSEITDVSDDGIAASHTNGSWTVTGTTVRDSSARGIDTAVSAGDWAVRNSEIEDTELYGIAAGESDGDWLVEATTIRDAEFGIDAPASTGDWTVTDSSIRSVVGGVNGVESSGSWELSDTQLTDTRVGVFAEESSGDWAVVETAIDNGSFSAVFARNTTGNWEVVRSQITRSGDTASDATVAQPAVINAVGTEAEWSVNETAFLSNSAEVINATGAAVRGEAAYNYWGAPDGPGGDFGGSGGEAIGNVTVSPFFTDESLTTRSKPTVRLELQTNRSSVVRGDPIRFTVTDSDGAPVDASRVELPGTDGLTGADGVATLRPETTGRLTATAGKSSATTTYISDSRRLLVNESTAENGDDDHEGTVVDPEGTDSVDAITFADEGVGGTVSIDEYQPDAELSEQIASAVSRDLDTTESGGAVDVVSVFDISPSTDTANGTAATIAFSIDSDEVANPENALVAHETDDGWEPLDTTVRDDDGELILEADTESFSLFAVVETENVPSEPESRESESQDSEPTGDDGSSSTGLAVGIAVVVVLGAVLVLRRRL